MTDKILEAAEKAGWSKEFYTPPLDFNQWSTIYKGEEYYNAEDVYTLKDLEEAFLAGNMAGIHLTRKFFQEGGKWK